MPRMPLSSILPDEPDEPGDVFAAFDASSTAAELAPVPKGVYSAVAVEGSLSQSRTGTPGYQVRFRIIEGEYSGRQVWRTWYLTPAALPYSRRDLGKLGIDSGAKLREPLPRERFVVKLTLTLRKADDGTEHNDVKAIELIRVQEPQRDPFAPDPTIAEAFDELDAPTGKEMS